MPTCAQKHGVRETLLALQLGRCIHCLTPFEPGAGHGDRRSATFDHVFPASFNPAWAHVAGAERCKRGITIHHVRLACEECNYSRGSVMLKDFWRSPPIMRKWDANWHNIRNVDKVWLSKVIADTALLHEAWAQYAFTYPEHGGDGHVEALRFINEHSLIAVGYLHPNSVLQLQDAANLA